MNNKREIAKIHNSNYTEIDYDNKSDEILRKLTKLQLERSKIDDYINWLHSEAKRVR